MKNPPSRELPIRLKVAIAQEVGEIIGCLHRGQRSTADLLIEDLKSQAVHLDEEIQQNVLMFAEQVQFQYDYDPWHKMTLDVQKAADKLIEGMGFSLPK